MGIQNSSLLDGATISVTGGTAATFVPDGLKVNNGVHLIDVAVADKTVQRSITASSNPSRYYMGEWQPGKRELTIAFPFVAANGDQKFPAVRIRLSDHPELDDTDLDAMMNLAAQMCIDTEFQSFWRRGDLS